MIPIYYLKNNRFSHSGGNLEPETGPYHASIPGCFHRKVSEQEVREYVANMHPSAEISRIEWMEFGNEHNKETQNE